MHVDLNRYKNEFRASVYYNENQQGIVGDIDFIAMCIKSMYERTNDPIYLDKNGFGIALSDELELLSVETIQMKSEKALKQSDSFLQKEETND